MLCTLQRHQSLHGTSMPCTTTVASHPNSIRLGSSMNSFTCKQLASISRFWPGAILPWQGRSLLLYHQEVDDRKWVQDTSSGDYLVEYFDNGETVHTGRISTLPLTATGFSLIACRPSTATDVVILWLE